MATWEIAHAGNVHGPFSDERIRTLHQSGRLKPGMYLSRDGGEWRPVEEVSELTQAAPPPPRRLSERADARRRALSGRRPVAKPRPRRTRRRGVPGAVTTACLIVYIGEGLTLVAGGMLMLLGVVGVAAVYLLLGSLHIYAAIKAQQGASGWRIVVIVVSVLGILGQLMRLSDGAPGATLGLLLNIAVVVLLSGPSASRFYTEMEARRQVRKLDVDAVFD